MNFQLKRLLKKPQNKIMNEEGVDVTPKALSLWNVDMPLETLEKMAPVNISAKKMIYGNKSSLGSGSTIHYKTDNDELMVHFNHPLYVAKDGKTDEVEILLTESETIWLFDMPDVNLTTALEDLDKVVQRNKEYLQLALRESEKMVNRSSMTLHNSRKNKINQTVDLEFKDLETQVTTYDFYDEEHAQDEDVTSRLKSSNSQYSATSQSTKSSSIFSRIDVKRTVGVDDIEKLGTVKNFSYLCSIAERLLQYNQFYIPMANYKKVPLLLEEGDRKIEGSIIEESIGFTTNTSTTRSSVTSFRPGENTSKNIFEKLPVYTSSMLVLKPLLKYCSPLHKEFNVTCMSFNKQNHDLIAAGYSQADSFSQKDGYVCCWCIKNIEYPERIIKLTSGATALAFSSTKPYLLAVGLFDGTLLFYNVSTKPPTLLHTSLALSESHMETIFALEWMEKNGFEMLLSTSIDGKVLKWIFGEELHCFKILELKTSSKHEKDNKNLSTTNSGGLCLDCSKKRSEIYLIGTDNGTIHKCSAIHANQFFTTYTSHIAPVYKVKWSPHEPTMFASCGADTTIKIWEQYHPEPLLDLLSINPPNNPALDMAWLEDRKGSIICLFGSELQVWDLFASKLDPAFIYYVDDLYTNTLTSLFYSIDAEAVYLGDCLGDIAIFRLSWLQEIPFNADLYQTLMSIVEVETVD